MSTAEAQARVDPAQGLLHGSEIPPPDHLGLPESDGRIVENWLEHPQGQILSDPLLPVLALRHPDGRYAMGRDTGIYYKWVPDDPLAGVIVPDWLYVPGVPATLDGQYRRSYVLWKERVAPLIALEFASGDGSEELDRNPPKGKFWVYEQAIRPLYYGVHRAGTRELQVFHLAGQAFRPTAPDARGLYPIPELGVALGLWEGVVENLHAPWMRWFDLDGRLLPSGNERAEAQAARAERLAAQLRALGVEPVDERPE